MHAPSKLFHASLILIGVSFFLTLIGEAFNLPRLFSALISLLGLIVLFPLSGINIASLLGRFSKDSWDWSEIIAIGSVVALVGMPFLLTLEYSLSNILSLYLPFANALLLALGARFWGRSLPPLSLKQSLRRVSPVFLIAVLVYIAVTLLTVFAYYPLPDSDPYYWYFEAQRYFQNNSVAQLPAYRPLFTSLTYHFHISSGIDLYAFFKYVLPFSPLLFVFPLWLLTKSFPQKLTQLLILLIPYSSAAISMYAHMPIPQTPLTILIVSFLSFLLHSWFSGKKSFYFLAGGVIFLAYFYHEIAVFFALPWLLITFWSYRHFLWKKAVESKTISFLIVLLFLSHSGTLLESPFHFLDGWISRAPAVFSDMKLNMHFPAEYRNIDGRSAGWGGDLGAVKYYAFYAGPAFLGTLFLFGFLLTRSSFRTTFISEWLRNKIFWSLFLPLVFFLVISDVLPRFNVAFLPDRAIVFAGLIILFFSLLALKTLPRQLAISAFLLISLLSNVGAALYANSLKKYLISPTELASASWVVQNLPANRVIFTGQDVTAMRVFAHTDTRKVTQKEFYTNLNIFEQELLSERTPPVQIAEEYHAYLMESLPLMEVLQEPEIHVDPNTLIPVVKRLAELNQTMTATLTEATQIHGSSLEGKHIFILYAKSHPKNPYAARPYAQIEEHKDFVFDRHPERFRRIYVGPKEEVVIWRYIDQS